MQRGWARRTRARRKRIASGAGPPFVRKQKHEITMKNSFCKLVTELSNFHISRTNEINEEGHFKSKDY